MVLQLNRALGFFIYFYASTVLMTVEQLLKTLTLTFFNENTKTIVRKEFYLKFVFIINFCVLFFFSMDLTLNFQIAFSSYKQKLQLLLYIEAIGNRSCIRKCFGNRTFKNLNTKTAEDNAKVWRAWKSFPLHRCISLQIVK